MKTYTLDTQLIKEKMLHDFLRETSPLPNYKVYYVNEAATCQTIEEVWQEQPYFFKADDAAPFIIDAGANIGISALYFKALYPASQLYCFEPDPYAFQLLEKNMHANHVTQVSLFNAALADREGEINFYGDFQPNSLDARGNSVMRAWGLQRQTSSMIQVNSVQLSTYLHQPVDLLKLDIEGAEMLVMHDIHDNLHFIKNIVIEYHACQGCNDEKELAQLIQYLEQQHFQVSYSASPFLSWPRAVHHWVSEKRPQLYHIVGTKRP